jgi:hypothetical protein
METTLIGGGGGGGRVTGVGVGVGVGVGIRSRAVAAVASTNELWFAFLGDTGGNGTHATSMLLGESPLDHATANIASSCHICG